MSESAPIGMQLRSLIRSVVRKEPRECPTEAVVDPGLAPQIETASPALTLVDLAADLRGRLASGQSFTDPADLAVADQLRQLLGGTLDVHNNPFSPRRYHDLLGPVLAQLGPEDLCGATVVDLSCGPLNPFTFSFLLLMLGADRAYALDREPIQDMSIAVRALAAAAGWMLLEPERVLDRPRLTPDELLRNLRGFDLPRLTAGDAAGLATGRLMHRAESLHDLSLPDETADLVFSLSLLEHMDPLETAMASLRRITKPGGLGIHVVDFLDHDFYAGRAASPFEFLESPADASLVHGSNRMRCDELCAAFERHGFSVDRVERWKHAQPLTEEQHARFVEPFRSMPRENVATAGARLFVRREAGSSTTIRRRRVRPTAEHATPTAAVNPQPVGEPTQQVYQAQLATARVASAADYVALAESDPLTAQALVTLIAFYLPQYHPIPENDAWWGRGFTEWTNVSKAVPQFAGHYQPHLPGELGFYDLRVPDVQRRQVELARKYGVGGFCFYYYWFGGKRLLERPLNQFTSDPEIDFPFCLCWANENWTRRWDGREDQILVEQDHTAETDAAFIADIEEILRHRNYIRVGGRPVLLVYRPQLLRDPAATAARWREHCRRVGLGDLYLIATEAFESVDPASIGFDAAVEFPPNTGGRSLPTEITSELSLANPDYAGAVYRYTDMMRMKIDRPAPAYQLFRGVCPGFDNEPRRPGAGSTYAFSSPATYGRWLESACRSTLAQPDRERRLVFINAWNEWAEGAHLEPDRRYGYAYLDATAKALDGLRHDWTILFVSHDACRGGAQLVLLDLLEWLKRHTAIRLKVLCLDRGEWLPRFRGLADTMLLSELQDKAARASEADLTRQLLDFCGGPPSLIYGNSVASGRAYAALARLNAPIVTHVHELQSSIERYAAGWMGDVLDRSAHYIACSEAVRDNLVAAHDVAPADITTVHASLGGSAAATSANDYDRPALRQRLGLPVDAPIVVGCGLGMPFRKGADLFIEVARHLQRQGRTDIKLYWVGEFPEAEHDPARGAWSDHLASLQTPEAPEVTFLGLKDDAKPYLAAADIFLLPSREDPFPLVALEAAASGVPIVCFDEAGGMPAFVGHDAGRVVPFEDAESMAAHVVALIDGDDERRALGERAREKVRAGFTTDATAPHILAACRTAARRKPAVSVIVPNYNHGRYLPERLSSIFNQTFRDVEVILLDDASSDDSVEVLERYRDRADVRIVRNARNSGSTFKQWLRGLDLARADIVWIAESDDACEPDFIEALLPALRDPRVKVAYANSSVVDERSVVVGDYTSNAYLTSLSATKWAHAYQVPAGQEIADGLGVKNTILSASSVMFRKFDLQAAARNQLESMRIAGDWYFFVLAMAGGDVAYTPRKLNFHRRHDESVVGKLLKESRVEQFFQEFYVVQNRIFEDYRLDQGFESKWEAYLRHQWDAFFPGRPFDELERYYPVGRVRNQIAASRLESAPA